LKETFDGTRDGLSVTRARFQEYRLSSHHFAISVRVLIQTFGMDLAYRIASEMALVPTERPMMCAWIVAFSIFGCVTPSSFNTSSPSVKHRVQTLGSCPPVP